MLKNGRIEKTVLDKYMGKRENRKVCLILQHGKGKGIWTIWIEKRKQNGLEKIKS